MPDDTGCLILHVDMDAFYASVEVARRPDLVGAPVVVAGLGGRGVVLSASYAARAFGVRSAMPTSQAQRLCPRAVFLPPRHERYATASRQVMTIFGSVTPEVEPIALDEAFLDVSGAVRRLGSPAAIGELIRSRVADEQRITCSVGVAPTKFVAKIASATCKPDGLLVVPRAGVLDFLHPLPVGALWGVGPRTAGVLDRLGLRSVGDIARTPVPTLQHNLGVVLGAHLAALARGRDDRPVAAHSPDRSIGAEHTFSDDVSDPVAIRRELLHLSDRTARALRGGGHLARTVGVKVRFADFTTVTRASTLAEPTDVAHTVYETACALVEAAVRQRLASDRGRRLRLVGVRATGLLSARTAATQLSLDECIARGNTFHGDTLHRDGTPWRDAERVVDRIAGRFGADAVRPAALLPDRQRREPWHGRSSREG